MVAGFFCGPHAATRLIEVGPSPIQDKMMIRAPIANAVIGSIIVAEILGGMMLLVHH
jgi:hypothetical protein